MDKNRILVFDTETTGLTPGVDKILQMTILDGYGRVKYESYFKVKKPLNGHDWGIASQINGITYEMVKHAPTIKSQKKQIQSVFNEADLIVGYNLNFDINFVEAEGIVVPGIKFDVMTAFASYRAHWTHYTRRHTLQQACAFFDYDFDPHNSRSDAEATLYCFNKMINDPIFTTYKKRKSKPKKKISKATISEEDKSEKIEESPYQNKKLGFSFQRKTLRRGWRLNVLLGLLFICVGEVLFWYRNNIFINSIESYLSELRLFLRTIKVFDISNVSILFITVGLVLLGIGCLRLIIRIPKVLLNTIKKGINRSLS